MLNKLILVVEDETELAELLREVLELEGHRVVVAPHGRAALSILDELSPDLILTDLMLPVMDGLEFLQRYSARPGPKAAVIAMSAMGPYLDEALKLGAQAILRKPFELNELTERISSVLAGAAQKPSAPVATPDETERLRAVLDLKLVQTPPGEALDRYTKWVAAVFEAPICLLSIITADEQVWTAQCGLPGELAARGRGPRNESFCTHSVNAQSALVVQDASTHPFFRDNVFVTQWGIRFYAGVPLLSRSGEAVGTLCLMDFAPRRFTHFDLELLTLLGRRVMHELDRREHAAHPDDPNAAFRYLSFVDEELNVFGREALTESLRVLAFRAAERQEPLTAAVISVETQPLDKVVKKLSVAFPRGFIGRLAKNRLGVVVPGAQPEVIHFQLERHGHDQWKTHVAAVRNPFGTESLIGRLEAAL